MFRMSAMSVLLVMVLALASFCVDVSMGEQVAQPEEGGAKDRADVAVYFQLFDSDRDGFITLQETEDKLTETAKMFMQVRRT